MMTTVTSEYRQHIPRPVWMTARARNALRRPVFIGAVALGAFLVALVAMVLVPQQKERAARAIAPKASDWPDTNSLLAVFDSARARLGVADSALTLARQRAATLASAPAIDTLDPVLAARRDSLSASVAALSKLITRAENAPLSSSYRALAEAPQIANDPRIRTLVDSLNDIEKQRESAGAVGGADPVFVALTARATEIGHSIESVASAKRDDMARAAAALTPTAPPPTGAQLVAADTTTHVAQRDTALRAYNVASAQLARARHEVDTLQARADRAREVASTSAPPLALLGASIIFGLVLGFGASLIAEVRRPRIADAHEAEWTGGARILVSVKPRPPAPERARRLADRNAPPYLDPASDAYQLLYLTVATAGASLLMVTVTGAEADVTAVVASNFAAIAAEEARNVLLIDLDSSHSSVAAALRIHPSPGFVDVLRKRTEWSEATVQVTIGRDRTIDVIPSGFVDAAPPDATELNALLQRDAARLARHYDAIILVAAVDQALGGLPAALPIGDAIYCARIGHTRLGEMRRGVEGLRSAGGNPLGVVLWDAEAPTLRSSEEPIPTRAAPRAEMPVTTASR